MLPRPEPFESVESYSGDGLEVAGFSVVSLGKEAARLLLRSLGTELFKSVELHVGDGHKMAGTLGKRLCMDIV